MDARPGVVPSSTRAWPQSNSVQPPAHGDDSVGPGSALDGVDDDLATLATLSSAEQVSVFARIHQKLTDALAVTGQQNGSAPAAPPRNR